MEGLAITPDGSTLVGLVQSSLLQDGGDGARTNRIVTIDVQSGATHEYVYDNRIGTKAFNSSEIIALNEHQFLIDTRDGKGLGDGSVAVVKQLWAVDIAGAEDVANLSGQATLLTKAVPKKLFLDLVPALNQNGIASTAIPAKIEGLAFGNDVTVGGVATHTLYVANDNDFLPDVAGPNVWYVFGFTDEYLASLSLSYTPQSVANPPPVIADVAVSSQVLWPPSNKLQTVTVSYNATDELPGTECSLSVNANEGSSADWLVVDAHTVQLRASRNGYGSGRVYSIPVSCVDRGGAVTVATATVSVPHDMR